MKPSSRTQCGDDSREVHADGVSVCYIKSFESSRKEDAESLCDALQEAWLGDNRFFVVE